MRVSFRNSLPALFAIVLAIGGGAIARGEIFELASGGEIRGRWANAEERPFHSYLVELPGGGRVRLISAQVKSVVRQSPQQQEYESLAMQCGNTVDAQWQMAEWCRQNKLTTERDAHLMRVVELDPDHTRARQALGYSFLDGSWVRRSEWRKDKGYQFYQGKWRLAQEIEILERRRKQELSEKDWLQKLRRLRAALNDSAKGAEAREQMAAVTDANAVPAIRELLKTEVYPVVRAFYVEMLGKIGAPAAELLMEVSILDLDEEVRYAALDQVAKLDPPHASKFYMTLLKDANNVKINRAAWALGKLNRREAIDPLIEALVTTHIVHLPGASKSPDATSTSFTGDGSTSFQQGAGPKTLRVHAQNDEVLKTLVKLAGGVSFSYDIPAWRAGRNSRLQAEAAGAAVGK